ncbi:DNA cytosine methyltransferase [Sharpea azabuensis]|uniref:DNA cytosine methyltransferase n=1 Tax=Sharpea azabuensis TaxID=322505 RepID=UPI000EC0933F|nr:DNA cytosine methyltransferase [Sharpea azabuensis]HAJ15504.1 DNA (cytosine-5-)-methyltransferase [Erysipelotrichaceae bacterium]
MSRLRIATVFSGIGAPEQALNKLGIDYEIVFACDNGERELKQSYEEILTDIKDMNSTETNKYIKLLYKETKKPNRVKESYFANYNIDENKWYEDIRFIDGNQFKDKVDLFVGGSPCQSFSIIGKRAGLNDARGTLFYDYARLIDEIKPKMFVYENVLGMLNHDHGNTWKHIREIFESLGYKIKYDTLNSMDYGIPQNRRRLFVVGFKNNNSQFEFPNKTPLTTTMRDYLEDKVAARHYLGEKGFKFVTTSKRANVNADIIQTQKANQQFNWNGDFVFEKLDKVIQNPEIMKRAYVGEFKGERGVCRQLSYRECARLMGFPDSFKIVVPNVPAYRQIGNSIVVNVLEAIFKNMFIEMRRLENDSK